MRIYLTGSTGFVGAHTALMLLKAGHDLRLLVRNKKFAQAYFSKHGYENLDYVEADMRNKEAVRASMAGCDAVLHAAAMVSLDPKKADEIYKNNIESISSVLGTAHELGIKNIVYVSSLGALFNPGRTLINEASPLGNSREAYSKSKRDCDEYVRKMQLQGAPIQITYPSGIFGPDDPRLQESNHALISLLNIIPITTSGIQCVDVRDLAKAHLHLLENPPESNFSDALYIVAGRYYAWNEFHQLLESITGKKIFSPRIPGAFLRFFGAIMDQIKKVYPIDFPMTSESMAIITQWTPADSTKIEQKFNLSFRSGEETFKDTVHWLVEAGHAKPKVLKNRAI